MAKKKILIVEDEEIVAMDIQDMLTDLGYEAVGIANSKEDAIEEIEKTNPDLVLMDIMLGGKDSGIETAEEIRTRFKIPVIYLTAYADDDTLERAKTTAPYGYIVKPFQEKDLSTMIIMGLYKHEMLMKIREETENALAAIMGSVELMLEDAPKKYDRETITKIDIIQRAVHKIKQSIEKI
ncbi:MAG TPA: response regulator [Thermodesulfobacteriota bacterium]|nr:response regulator [Thermodesulfobacteriota bacterium]